MQEDSKDALHNSGQTKDETETLRASYRHSETETTTQAERHMKTSRGHSPESKQ